MKLVLGGYDAVGGKTATWLEGVASKPGVADALQRGEAVTVVDAPSAEVRISWPNLGLGANMRVGVGPHEFYLQFYPPGGGFGMLGTLPRARRAAQPWRRAFE